VRTLLNNFLVRSTDSNGVKHISSVLAADKKDARRTHREHHPDHRISLVSATNGVLRQL
jgi:hypothetical protein